MIIQEVRVAGVMPGILASVHVHGRPGQPERRIQPLPE
jgi:hypothetical protein